MRIKSLTRRLISPIFFINTMVFLGLGSNIVLALEKEESTANMSNGLCQANVTTVTQQLEGTGVGVDLNISVDTVNPDTIGFREGLAEECGYMCATMVMRTDGDPADACNGKHHIIHSTGPDPKGVVSNLGRLAAAEASASKSGAVFAIQCTCGYDDTKKKCTPSKS